MIFIVQGTLGSYSEDAALKACPNCETVPCSEIEDAFKVTYFLLLCSNVKNIANCKKFVFTLWWIEVVSTILSFCVFL